MSGCYNCGANQFARDWSEKGEGGKKENFFEKSKGMSKGKGKNLHEVEEDENRDDQADMERRYAQRSATEVR